MARPFPVSAESFASPAHGNTCAIVVTYHPDDQFAERIKRVTGQFPKVIIVDNGSNATALAMLRRLAGDEKIELLENPVNLGIASALNQGVAAARQQAFQWAVSLDQDTLVYPDMLQTLLAAYAAIGQQEVLVGGNYENVNKQKDFVSRHGQDIYLERKTLITSGTLMPLDFTMRIGGFRDDYFIDSVDHEFCLRARSNGVRVMISRKPVMSQHIGSGVQSKSWFARFASFDHAPVRKYFIARNTLVTARDYFFREPVWATRQVWRLLSDFASIFLFENDKKNKAAAFAAGLHDGFRNRMGPARAGIASPQGSK